MMQAPIIHCERAATEHFEVPDISLRRIALWMLGVLIVGAFFWLLLRLNYVVLLLPTAAILSWPKSYSSNGWKITV